MEYLKLIEDSRDEMAEMLRQLIAIRSVADSPQEDMPFGKGVHDAFFYMLDRGKRDGFEIENIDNYGGHLEFGEGQRVVGVLGHLDVVPEGNDWDVAPYGAPLTDGKIYGRGAQDNKGPVVASYFAMKALKDSGYEPEVKIRLILGLDEETNWVGMNKYLQKVNPPSVGFAPDADFPVIHGEKGILIFDLAKKIKRVPEKGLLLRSFKGGSAPNMVADFARVIVRDDASGAYEKIKDEAASYRYEKKRGIYVKGMGKSLEITARGVSSHGAKPENGVNAISVMMDFLSRFSFSNDEVNEFISFYNEHIGFDLDGSGLGCNLSDEISGSLILNVGMIDMTNEAVSLKINVRYPVTLSDASVYDSLAPVIGKYDLGLVKGRHQPPIYFPKGSPLVKTLMNVYRNHTGDTESDAIIIGGGTYARAASNLVAFGANYPGEEEMAHKKNEYVEIDRLVLTAKIFADAIYELSVLPQNDL